MMSHLSSMERLADALDRAQRHWAQRRAAGAAWPTAQVPTIALSREAGVPGTSIAHEVGARLGWHVYGHELVDEIARQMGLRSSLLESVDERRRTWFQETLSDAFALPLVSESGYVRHLFETILSLGAHGECVLVGRGSSLILPPATTLRVRLIGALEDRLSAVMGRLNVDRSKALDWIEETERERRAFAREHFRKDVTDPLNSDLILNTSRWSVGDCADLIVEALRRFQVRMTRP